MRTCSACTRDTDESGRFCPHCGADLVEPGRSTAASLVGLTIDQQFVIEAVLGGGSFGAVYRARQLGLERPVALKVPTREIAADPVMARRFAREARAAARIRHPGVVAIYAVGELPDRRPYLAMELVDGEPLDRAIVNGPIAPHRALAISRAIASALGETHAADVVHRDLKPSNVIWRLDRNGDDRITLVDFGIAVCKPGTAEATRLTAGGVIGTPHYMSPEQAHGDEVDARADLYALGCLLFELVTATTLYEGSSFEVLLAHLGRPAPAPSQRNPEVPEAIDRLCAALLAKKPADRPASADAVVTMIDRISAELEGRAAATSASATKVRRPRPTTQGTRRELPPGVVPPRRTPRWLVAAGALAIALGGAGFGAFVLDHDTGRTPPADAASAAAEPIDQPNGPVHAGPGRRRLVLDDGDLVLRALLPDPVRAATDIRPHLAITNKLGQPVVAPEVVVTVADPEGKATGLTAKPHGDHPGHYTFHVQFPTPGKYVIRVFPPSVDSAFEIPVDVVASEAAADQRR